MRMPGSINTPVGGVRFFFLPESPPRPGAIVRAMISKDTRASRQGHAAQSAGRLPLSMYVDHSAGPLEHLANILLSIASAGVGTGRHLDHDAHISHIVNNELGAQGMQVPHQPPGVEPTTPDARRLRKREPPQRRPPRIREGSKPDENDTASDSPSDSPRASPLRGMTRAWTSAYLVGVLLQEMSGNMERPVEVPDGFTITPNFRRNWLSAVFGA